MSQIKFRHFFNNMENKKNIFWFHSHPNNYIEPFQKECKKKRHLRFSLQPGKEYSGLRYSSDGYREILAQLSREHEHFAGRESKRSLLL